MQTGAKVISCSWGSYHGGHAGRQVIDYATEHGALVVAAAGNRNVENLHYPSGYENAVAVAATDRNDRKAGFSCYGRWVDISAPGVNIYSTYPGGRYVYMSGTSMACPFAASVAILIRAAFPDLTVQEARQILLEGADDIDDINDNYRGKLGSGRINAYESLLLGDRPILLLGDVDIVRDDNDNGRLEADESADIYILISNSESGIETEEITISISSEDPSLSFPSDEVEFPNLGPGDELMNEDQPLVIEIADEIIPHTTWFTISLAAEPGHIRLERTYEIIVGFPGILIIDDDDGQAVEPYYISAIEQMKRGWVRWDVTNNSPPEAEVFQEYEMVIWITGDAEEPLDSLDRMKLGDALDDGVNVLLVGKRIGDNQANRELLRDYFGAEHEADSISIRWVRGLSGERPVPEEDIMLMVDNHGNGDGRNSPSTMRPVNGADSLLVYLNNREEVSGCAGVYRIDRRTGSRLIYLGYSFEGGSGYRDHTEPYVVLERLYNWFTGDFEASPFDEGFTATRFELDQACPNPFNSAVRIGYTLPGNAEYKLAILDLTGRELELLETGIAAGGRYSVVWDAVGMPSGIYFARLTSPGMAPIERKLLLVK